MKHAITKKKVETLSDCCEMSCHLIVTLSLEGDVALSHLKLCRLKGIICPEQLTMSSAERLLSIPCRKVLYNSTECSDLLVFWIESIS